MKVYICKLGHLIIDDNFCGECGCSYELNNLEVVQDPYKIMQFAESLPEHDKYDRHRFADAAILIALQEFNPTLAERYQTLENEGFWYA